MLHAGERSDINDYYVNIRMLTSSAPRHHLTFYSSHSTWLQQVTFIPVVLRRLDIRRRQPLHFRYSIPSRFTTPFRSTTVPLRFCSTTQLCYAALPFDYILRFHYNLPYHYILPFQCITSFQYRFVRRTVSSLPICLLTITYKCTGYGHLNCVYRDFVVVVPYFGICI